MSLCLTVWTKPEVVGNANAPSWRAELSSVIVNGQMIVFFGFRFELAKFDDKALNGILDTAQRGGSIQRRGSDAPCL
ncbi:hypothetical protein BC936DRAFT_142705 [Jimgerdemannia flammicorona]|uniref:Uncharacterized protein n=2 Tax=Jimgerdemannia flammicorona TaxID=994334 RepID=A0A433QN81_9FUNG|nr:hypothetical protein BC936DRAFT_142705 [Jimgerdemannia flammicorona]RUS31218.1 hypothetical protein BC938DRAFT_478241 [Jimgerdemannia flammicorona]